MENHEENEIGFDFDRLDIDLVPEPYKSDGWIYRDIPTWFSPEMYEHFRSIIGFDEHKILVSSQRNIDGQMFIHCQMIISPKGFENMRKHADERRKLDEPERQ